MSSALTEYFDFQTSQEVYAAFLALFWLLYFLSTGCFKTCGPANTVPHDQSLEEQKQELVEVKVKTDEDKII